MRIIFATHVGTYRKLILLIIAGSAVLALIVYLKRVSMEVVPNPPAAENRLSTRFGPGVWIEKGPEIVAAGEFEPSDTAAPLGLEIDSGQHLIVNKALRDVIDYFLLGGHPGERSTHRTSLLAHLKTKLPAFAYAEAAQVVQNYLSYINAHDQLLAREATPAPTAESSASPMDMDRIEAWLAQRARLRQSLLGIAVAQAWFGEEEADTRRTLDDMRKRGAGAAPTNLADPDPFQQATSTLDALRFKGASREAQRRHIATQFGAEAAQRFDAMEREEQAWQAHYANYRRAANEINLQAGTDPIDRARQLETLRAQTFVAEPERIRALALDAQATANTEMR